MTIVTRFAPSPTGMLHIGGARTALFNYLFARKNGGKFLLRIEDTDKQRSTKEAIDAILVGMKWLGLDHDDEIVYQSEREARHREVAEQLVALGKAYYCFESQESVNTQREAAQSKGESFIFRSPWRNVIDSSKHPKDVKPVIRLKVNPEGATMLNDLVQGVVEVRNDHLDDMVLLRSDGTPTYMLAVVVDDHDMGVTHIIRGDDHLNNAFRQIQIYKALDWNVPIMAHIPLIHGPDGAKLSKRHGAVGLQAYQEEGYLSDAIFNYLLRLGWSCGDKEIFSRQEAIELFTPDNLNKAPARLDFDKMKNLNAHYIQNMDDSELLDYIYKKLATISNSEKENIKKAVHSIKTRIKLLPEAIPLARLYLNSIPVIESEALESAREADTDLIKSAIEKLSALENYDSNIVQEALKEVANEAGIKIGALMKPLRCLITGQLNSPSVFEIIAIIGKEQTLNRLSRKDV